MKERGDVIRYSQLPNEVLKSCPQLEKGREAFVTAEASHENGQSRLVLFCLLALFRSMMAAVVLAVARLLAVLRSSIRVAGCGVSCAAFRGGGG